MKKSIVTDKLKMITAVALAAAVAMSTALLTTDAVKVRAQEDLPEAGWCSFVIPSEFVPGPESGVFINRNYPMESSTIKYSFYDNGKDVTFTNRQRQEESFNVPGNRITDEPTLLTKEIYEETLSAAFNSKYGQDVGFAVESFDDIEVDGYPGFKIRSSYRAEGEETIHQTVYMLISKYKVFTVTYQRAEDDDCEEQFEKSADTIHVN
ncbi:hypothetical protein [Butyrivibrio sp. FCS014]|uniref:hypothetical protein n=1 Tax=Butyrivibrio sp. FCS014 TaxID=1408304 RepID=UPI00046607A9|nr:hypothetical protein [Butyrivibrio sp. FCS014]